MIRVQRQVVSPHPPEVVWPLMADFAHTERWDPGVARSRRTTSAPVGEGTTYDVDVKTGPTTQRMVYRVWSYEPPRRVLLEGVGWFFRAVDDIRVAPGPEGGSVVTWRAELTLRGPLKPATALMGPGFRQVAEHAMTGLRAWLTQDPAPSVDVAP